MQNPAAIDHRLAKMVADNGSPVASMGEGAPQRPRCPVRQVPSGGRNLPGPVRPGRCPGPRQQGKRHSRTVPEPQEWRNPARIAWHIFRFFGKIARCGAYLFVERDLARHCRLGLGTRARLLRKYGCTYALIRWHLSKLVRFSHRGIRHCQQKPGGSRLNHNVP